MFLGRQTENLGTLKCAAQALKGSRGEHFGGGERNRTDDLLLAKQALSQLSYTPA